MLVMVVEDELDVRETVSECLIENGFNVVAVADGREALDKVEATQPDVVLLDLVMSDMDGWAFREEQRKRPAIRDVPVVVMTGASAVNRADLQASVVLMKPFTMESLVAAIFEAHRRGVGHEEHPQPG
jgi:CheY-like chemotaxis protein